MEDFESREVINFVHRGMVGRIQTRDHLMIVFPLSLPIIGLWKLLIPGANPVFTPGLWTVTERGNPPGSPYTAAKQAAVLSHVMLKVLNKLSVT